MKEAHAQHGPPCVQEEYAAKSICFGCGPANAQGLRIRSMRAPAGSTPAGLVAVWHPQPFHHAFPGVLNGGICGALLDCHSNWTASIHLMDRDGLAKPPCTVTADFHVALKRPTPMDAPLELAAHVVESSGPRAVVEATLTAKGKVTATCRGTFVAVTEGHPAFHRW